jgi:hypothetical protein
MSHIVREIKKYAPSAIGDALEAENYDRFALTVIGELPRVVLIRILMRLRNG